MNLTIIGCSGSFPSTTSAASCYLIEAEDSAGKTWRLVLDLGSGAIGPLQRAVELAAIDAVLISHLHPDHFLDLCGLYVARRYHPTRAATGALPVYGPQGTAERVRDAYGPDRGGVEASFDVRSWTDGEPVRFGPVTVTPRLVSHPVPAFGFRVEHEGRALAYSGDTDACPALTELAAGAELLLAEASFVEGRDDVRGVHLTGRRAGRSASEAGAGRLVLTHIPVWTDPATVLAEARQAFTGPVDLAAPGETYKV